MRVEFGVGEHLPPCPLYSLIKLAGSPDSVDRVFVGVYSIV
jgi:hypothetical protein